MKTTDRCVVCNRPGSRMFPLVNDNQTPRIPLCNRHRNEQDHIGWELFCDKYDIVFNWLCAHGFEFNFSGQVKVSR